MLNLSEKTRFLLSNLLKGFIWLMGIIAIFILFKKYVDQEFLVKLERITGNTFLVYLVFFTSELFFGIIPPELFMIWGLGRGTLLDYANIIAVLSVISYFSGFSGFLFGRFLNTTRFYKFVRVRYLRRYERKLNNYGLYLIIVASLTPVPYSAICMLVGAVKYPVDRFLLFSLFRFLRFAAYSAFIWEANMF